MRQQSGRDATRRSRNIGTAKQGHGQNNRLSIPQSWHTTKIFVENLDAYTQSTVEIGGQAITILVEATRRDCEHACSAADIAHILRFVPPGDLRGLEMIVLRQPKRKEEVLSSVWGRWYPFIEIGARNGSTIFLEALALSRTLRWTRHLDPDQQRRLQLLRDDGHAIRDDGRFFHITSTLESVRTTQLYWTLLHEIGHHVDFSRDEEGFETKPSKDKEAFAGRYADEAQARLRAAGVIPFERMA
jgi:hypothetical protein